MSDWFAAIERSAQVLCKSTSDETVYASCLAGKGDQAFASWAPGSNPPSLDKPFLRDYLETLPDWDKQPPAPHLPA